LFQSVDKKKEQRKECTRKEKEEFYNKMVCMNELDRCVNMRVCARREGVGQQEE
jgi:hypothetical protein